MTSTRLVSINHFDQARTISLARKIIDSSVEFSNKAELTLELLNHDNGAPNRVVKISKLINAILVKTPLQDILPLTEVDLNLSIAEENIPTAKTTIENLQKKFSIAETKRFLLLGKDREAMLHTIKKSELSTKERLEARFTLKEVKYFISYLRDAYKNKDQCHFILNPSNPFFYGTDEGQRMCVQAKYFVQKNFKAFLQEEIDILAPKFLAFVTKKMDGEEKTSWRQVVNYWLAGSASSQLGLAGEQCYGRTKNSDKLKLDANSLINSESIDFSNKKHDEKYEFLSIFRKSQLFLNKDWTNDVKREHYLYKPKSNSSPVDIDRDLINRRMCKWTIHNTYYYQQPAVYALDKIDLKVVAQGDILNIQNVKTDELIKQKVPVCTSELREIFRNFDKYEKHVYFYEKLKPTSTPWAADRDPEVLTAWAAYAMHLTRKLLLQHPTDQCCIKNAKMILTCWENGESHDVITHYHAIKPSQLRTPPLPINKRILKAYEKRTQAGNLENVSQVEKIISQLTDHLILFYQPKASTARTHTI